MNRLFLILCALGLAACGSASEVSPTTGDGLLGTITDYCSPEEQNANGDCLEVITDSAELSIIEVIQVTNETRYATEHGLTVDIGAVYGTIEPGEIMEPSFSALYEQQCDFVDGAEPCLKVTVQVHPYSTNVGFTVADEHEYYRSAVATITIPRRDLESASAIAAPVKFSLYDGDNYTSEPITVNAVAHIEHLDITVLEETCLEPTTIGDVTVSLYMSELVELTERYDASMTRSLPVTIYGAADTVVQQGQCIID